MATDGNSSYAIFTYQCDSLEWARGYPHHVNIGFSAGNDFYANIVYSESAYNVTDIDCLNEEYSNWTNIIYCVSKACRNSTSNSEGVQSGKLYIL